MILLIAYYKSGMKYNSLVYCWKLIMNQFYFSLLFPLCKSCITVDTITVDRCRCTLTDIKYFHSCTVFFSALKVQNDCCKLEITTPFLYDGFSLISQNYVLRIYCSYSSQYSSNIQVKYGVRHPKFILGSMCIVYSCIYRLRPRNPPPPSPLPRHLGSYTRELLYSIGQPR
jgi:hypothetical protein